MTKSASEISASAPAAVLAMPLPRERQTLSQPRPTGRPTTYTMVKGGEICRRLARGENLAEISREPGQPSYDIIFDWRRKYPEFAAAYDLAREAQADFRHDEIISIADDQSLTPDERRVMIDARKWAASRQNPRKYGDRQEVTARLTLEQLVLGSMRHDDDEQRLLDDQRLDR
jgi:hypothetical protein